MKYAVVIVTYNRLELLKECIAAVENQKLHFDDVVIVDNASTDGTRDYLKKYENAHHVIYETKNGGGAKGFKDGVEFVHKNLEADWLLLIDDDAILDQNFIYNINVFVKNNPSYKAVSGSVTTGGKIDITHRKNLKSGMTFSIIPVDKAMYENDSFDYDLSSFCGLLFSTDLIEKIGYPKEEYFIWYDDSEYSLRLGKETKLANVNSAWLNHKTKKAAQKDTLNWKGYYGIRNMGDIVRIYGTGMQYRLYRARVYVALFRNYLLSVIKKEDCYKFNYSLYKDALRDMKSGVFGFNTKYHP